MNAKLGNVKKDYSFSRVVKSRSVSAKELSMAAIGYALKMGESIFTGYRFDLSLSDNEIALSELQMELNAIKAFPVKLIARFEGDGDSALPFYCAKISSSAALESLLRRYHQKTAVRLVDGQLKGYRADDCQDNWLPLGGDGPVPKQVISYYKSHFGPRIYFDYPAQRFVEKAYEMAVVQKPPIWRKTATCSQEA